MTSSNRVPNRLGNEKSPYLLQHAHNPVYWYPWSGEAFQKAKKEDKPIFLSIGYSTCHWCHVMAHESFEDDQVAQLLNDNFISIKVDREERPDIDAVYMTACQVLTGSGGWPLTIVMTPDQRPFFAGTYLPKASQYGMIGLVELLGEIARQWESDREKLLSAGDQLTDFLQKSKQSTKSAAVPSSVLLAKARNQFSASFDSTWGGFGRAPKFPSPHNLLFLLRFAVLEGDNDAQNMVERTLKQMYKGGIFDHIGGGFSRYSTDEKWLIPHFEKMLYDNALLAFVYMEAYQMTDRLLYRKAAERTLDYVLRELTDCDGGFYCGQDADSEGVEGKFYAFSPIEINEVLGEEDGFLFCNWFDITKMGNFEGKSIPNLLTNPRFEDDEPAMRALILKLYQYRLKRMKLHKDDKILTSWNGLMILALAKAGLVLAEPKYTQAAQNAQLFIEKHLIDDQNRLKVRWKDGDAANMGQLDDYAFYGLALVELYQVTFEVNYLKNAENIAQKLLELFQDEKNGGFYLNANDAEQLIIRPKETYDGAIPSGNSVAALLLLRLSRLTGEEKWRKAADRQLGFLAGEIEQYPAGHTFALLALLEELSPSSELVCVSATEMLPQELMDFLKEKPRTNLSILIKTFNNQEQLARSAPLTDTYPLPSQGVAYYLCQNKTCLSPTNDFSKIREKIE